MMTLLRLVIIGIVILAGLTMNIRSASCYELLGYEWEESAIGFRVNANFPDDVGTGSQQRAAIRCGATSWVNQAAVDFTFIYQGSTSEDEADVFDGLNAVFYAEENPGDSILAVTFWGADVDGNFLGFDIVFYEENDDGDITWVGVGDAEDGETDIIGAAVHEFGHALGLDHTDVDDATMVGTIIDEGLVMRTLETDDIDGCTFLYGEDTDVDTDPTIDEVDPASGDATGGYEVVLRGVNYTWEADTTLTIDGEEIDSGDWELTNCSTLTIESMPSGAVGFVDIEITSSLGTVLLEEAFEYLAVDLPPEIESIDPALGSLDGGDPVTIIGANFTDDITATLGGEDLTDLTFVSSTELTGETPVGAAAGFVDLVLTQSNGSATLEDAYEYFDDEMRALDASGAPGQEVTTFIEVSNSCILDGYSFGLDFDGDVLEVLEVVVDGTDAEAADLVLAVSNNDAEPDGGYWTIAVLMDLTAPLDDLLPVGTNNTIARATYLISDDAEIDSDTTLEVRDDLGTPEVPVELACEGGELRSPTTATGTITIVEGVEFRRGDVDGNGTTFPIIDALFLLEWAFQGGDEPGCMKATDIDDNGVSFPIIDVLALLEWAFNGADAPPAPGPDTCGFDETDDDLTCDEGC